MKKILFVCDGGNFSNGAFEFLKLMNEKEKISVKGIFFTPVDFQELVSISYIPVAGPYVRLKEEERELVQKSKEAFIKHCESSGISYNIHDENEEWAADLLAKETRFADLAIISEELFCSDISSNQPNLFMQEALRKTECPVILIPENFKSIDSIVIAYDGRKESLFALKQFCYLLPQLTEMPAEFVYVKNEANDEIPDLDLLKEFSRLHFSSLGVSKLRFDAHKYFSVWAEEKKNVLLVTGSFSRSAVSSLLKSSFAEQVVRDHMMPVFVAHQN